MALISYDSFKIEKKADCVKLSAGVLVEFENADDESNGYSITMPKDWSVKFSEKVNISNYDIYTFVAATVPFGNCNAVTDRKKVWGLTGYDSKDGIFDCSYEGLKNKIYLGLIKDKSIKDSSIIAGLGLSLLIPKGTVVPSEMLKVAFVNAKLELYDYNESWDNFLSGLQKKIPKSILLQGYLDRESNICLNIYAEKADDLF